MKIHSPNPDLNCKIDKLWPASFTQHATSLLSIKYTPSSLSKPVEKSGLSFLNLGCLH